MLNQIVLIGRLTKDPELRYTPNGHPVANFTLAVDRDFQNANGEKETDFIQVQVWRKLAELTAQYLSKGRLAAVSGRLQIRSYDKDGERRWAAEVVADKVKFLDWGKGQQEGGGTTASTGSGEDVGDEVRVSEDDIPF